MSEPVAVCPADELDPGERQIVETDRFSIGVFNVDGEYHALLNRCVHQGGEVCQGNIYRDVEGEFTEPGAFVAERYTDRKVIQCPLHGWRYDIETGEHAGDPSLSLPTFDVVVEDGHLYVSV